MDYLTAYKQGALVVGELPPHITVNDFNKLILYCEEQIKNGNGKQTIKKWIKRRMLLMFLWTTGVRINDALNFKANEINYHKKEIYINVDKIDETITIPIDVETLFELQNYVLEMCLKPIDLLFKMKRSTAWRFMRKIGDKCNIMKLHPHKFRHGMAIHLLNQGIHHNIIAARLGHKNPSVTLNTYMKITLDVQKEALANIKWR